MGIILWIIFGAVVGWIASLVMGTDAQQGAMANIIIGVIGALVGGFVAAMVGGTGVTGFNIYSMAIAVLGAVIVIWLAQALRRS